MNKINKKNGTGSQYLLILLLPVAILYSAQGLAKDYSYLLPKPLPGWTVGQIQVEKATELKDGKKALRTKVGRLYFKGNNIKIAVSLNNLDCKKAMAIKLIHQDKTVLKKWKDPARLYRHKGYQGLESIKKSVALTVVNLKISECGVVSVGGAADSAKYVSSYVDRLPMKKIKGWMSR